MKADDYTAQAESALRTLCSVKPNRRTGSPGNREATDFFAAAIRSHGYQIDATPFECLDHVSGGAELTHNGESFDVHVSPYSLGCDALADIVSVSTVEELERADCAGEILLLRGDLCSEQLMPKNFVFYNPPRHQQIIELLESRKPAAIVAATEGAPDQVGALSPFPLIVDGDFDVPSVYCRKAVGDVLAAMEGDSFRLRIDARRLPARATNVIATLNGDAAGKIVITAHIDAYEESPGASDNASGVVVLLLCADMLSDYRGAHCIEIAALNGEDHYSAAGQMDYLKRYGAGFPTVLLAVNVDDVGYRRGRCAYSFHECPRQLQDKVEHVLRGFEGLVPGEHWFSGDHMLFVQSRVPAMALTSECMAELMRSVTHTAADTPDIVDTRKLVEVAQAVSALVRSL